jgi:hypothetical protein
MLRAARRRERRAQREYYRILRRYITRPETDKARAEVQKTMDQRLARSIAYAEAYPDDFEEIPF